MRIPRLVISAFSGGAGKTLISLGLARAFSRCRSPIRAFKKGPDYIDAAWLSRAARTPQGTLDPFFTPALELRDRFVAEATGCSLALIEGNRGLFDGLDIQGSCSTAELARILSAPVLLVLDCTKMTRTAAALVKGCLTFEPDPRIGGVLLNRIGNPRHQAMVRQAVEELAGVPVFGLLPRAPEIHIPERHMGLIGIDESPEADAYLDSLADFVAGHTDLDAIYALACSAPPFPLPATSRPTSSASAAPAEPVAAVQTAVPISGSDAVGRPTRKTPFSEGGLDSSVPPLNLRRCRPRIGYVYDAAFWFYYRENLEALERAGATLLPLSLLSSNKWPAIDGLYIGGGLPELHLERLSANGRIRAHVARLCKAGLPVYAECGGFLYLSARVLLRGTPYSMAGVFAENVEFCDRPQGLGYVEAEVVADNPFLPPGLRFRGHEFHFSRCLPSGEAQEQRSGHVLRLSKGQGMARSPEGAALDGLVLNRAFASYTHLYAPAIPSWAPAFTALCRQS